MELACINEKIIPIQELDPVYLDRGTYFGDGVYEVVRSYDGRLFALPEHLERFKRSLDAIGIENVDISEIADRIHDAYARADIRTAKLYFHITRGSEMRNHLPRPTTSPNFFMTVTKLTDDPNPEGIAVSTYPDWRWKRCDIKSLNLLANILARMDAEKRGCEEAILVDDTGEITEGAGSAFFVILRESSELVTRPLGPEILPSITRMIIAEVAPRVGLKFVEKALTPFQAQHADEMFIAVTTRDIVPVTRFDNHIIGGNRPGELTMKLKAAFREEVTARL